MQRSLFGCHLDRIVCDRSPFSRTLSRGNEESGEATTPKGRKAKEILGERAVEEGSSMPMRCPTERPWVRELERATSARGLESHRVSLIHG